MKPENLLHRTFNRLTAIGIAGRNKYGRVRWLWRCSCGRLKVITASEAKNGYVKSCGCFLRERIIATVTTHGASANNKVTPEYEAWSGLKDRCTNQRKPSYKNYGGRGITFCERWRSFENFFADMGPRPSPAYTLERVDNEKGYEPSNCKWATHLEQSRNRRGNVRLTFNGQTLCVADWAQRLGMSPYTLYSRLSRSKWSAEKALSTPLMNKKEQPNDTTSM